MNAAPDRWRRLPRRAVALWIVPVAVASVIAALVLALVGLPAWAVLGTLLLPPVMTWPPAHLGWSRTTYRVGDRRLEVHEGVLVRRRRTVALERVRSVDVEADPYQRLWRVATLRVGSGEQDGGELRLRPLHRAGAEALRRVLLDRRSAPQPEDELARLDRRWLRFAPLTVSVVLAAAGGLLGAAAQALEGPGLEVVRGLTAPTGPLPLWLLIVGSVAVALVSGTVASAAQSVEAWWAFRLVREPTGGLHVRRGLLTTRSVTIDPARLRGVELCEPLALRWAGGARLRAVAVGLRDSEQAPGRTALLPPAPVAAARATATAVLGVATDDIALRPHPPAARRRRIVRAVGAVTLGLAPLVLLGALITPVLLWTAAGLAAVALPAAVAAALDGARSLGHGADGTHVVARSGSAIRRTVALRRDGIVGWCVRESWGQRRAGLLTVVATTAAGRGGYAIRDADAGEVLAFCERQVPNALAALLVEDGTR